jgi:hypothetical protein
VSAGLNAPPPQVRQHRCSMRSLPDSDLVVAQARPVVLAERSGLNSSEPAVLLPESTPELSSGEAWIECNEQPERPDQTTSASCTVTGALGWKAV